jgi:hypothetical protein
MENLTHSLCAAALARTALGRRSPLSAPALLFPPALQWTPPSRPDRDIGLSRERLVSPRTFAG